MTSPTPAEIEAARGDAPEPASRAELQRSKTAFVELSAAESRELLVEESPANRW